MFVCRIGVGSIFIFSSNVVNNYSNILCQLDLLMIEFHSGCVRNAVLQVMALDGKGAHGRGAAPGQCERSGQPRRGAWLPQRHCAASDRCCTWVRRVIGSGMKKGTGERSKFVFLAIAVNLCRIPWMGLWAFRSKLVGHNHKVKCDTPRRLPGAGRALIKII